ncbi:prepilin-type N-terminal cleavage/methylation domain-containing protein [Candidatus Gracilibacteria bacterium]|nr:prepilin-type N-terminal cleavage/methylation domain-containing protein [Candidatus Gracilibacteria bacterium]
MKTSNKKGFSIIEVLVGIFIFTLGMVGVYAIISSTLRINDTNQNYIIASNLAREQLELVRNIRDSNYKVLKPYNLKNPSGNSFTSGDKFEFNKKYKIENDYSNIASFPIKVDEINDFGEGISEINGKMRDYRLCLDSKNRYTYDCITSGNKKTEFYKYISVEKVEFSSGGLVQTIDNSFLLKSKVIWYKGGYHQFEVKSVIADWKRL